MKHLLTAHASTKLVAKNTVVDTVDDDSRLGVANVSSANKEGHRTFRALIGKIPGRADAGLPYRKTFSKYINAECAKINAKLKRGFEGSEYVSTTADIRTAHNRSYLSVTAHWIHPHSMRRKKAALACRQLKGCHTHDNIATELDNIHSFYGIYHKITSTVTDNDSNFIKAFKKYQPVRVDESGDDEDEVTFMNINDVLQNDDDDDVVVILPLHQRCGLHTLNLVSCAYADKWILSRPETKAIYRSTTMKCTALWNKASR